MIIKSIELRNFRNYENLDIHLDEGTNILYGDNAQGKTNILEAAYLSGTTKSHKGSRDKEMIRFGEKESHIRTVVQKKEKEHKNINLISNPNVDLPEADTIHLKPDKEERLSEIIAEINSKTGRSYDNDVAVKAMLQIRDILLKSEKLKTSAKNNTEKDFEFAYFDDIDDALIEGLEQNQDFFTLLLSNDEIKRQVLGIFTEEIYKSLRNA